MSQPRILAALGMCVVLIIAWAQRQQIALQKQLLAAHAQATAQLQQGLDTLQEHNARNQAQMAELLRTQQRVQTQLTARQTEIRRLQHDVQAVRDWATQPLPADIVRLLDQPAALGAGAYHTPVPASRDVQPDGGQPQDQRRLDTDD